MDRRLESLQGMDFRTAQGPYREDLASQYYTEVKPVLESGEFTPTNLTDIWQMMWLKWHDAVSHSSRERDKEMEVEDFPYSQEWIEEQKKEGRIIVYVPREVSGPDATQRLIDTFSNNVIKMNEGEFRFNPRRVNMFDQYGWMAVDGAPSDTKTGQRLPTSEEIVQMIKDGNEFPTVNTYLIASNFYHWESGKYLDAGYDERADMERMPVLGTMEHQDLDSLSSHGQGQWEELKAGVEEYEDRRAYGDNKKTQRLSVSPIYRFGTGDDSEEMIAPRRVYKGSPPELTQYARLYLRDIESTAGEQPSIERIVKAVDEHPVTQVCATHTLTRDYLSSKRHETTVFAYFTAPASLEQMNGVIGEITHGMDPRKLKYNFAKKITTRYINTTKQTSWVEVPSLFWMDAKDGQNSAYDNDQYTVYFYHNKDVAFLAYLIFKYTLQEFGEKDKSSNLTRDLSSLIHGNQYSAFGGRGRFGADFIKKYAAFLKPSAQLNEEISSYLNSTYRGQIEHQASIQELRGISETLRSKRRQWHLGIPQAATQLGIPPTLLYALENGDVSEVNPELRKKIEEFIGGSIPTVLSVEEAYDLHVRRRE